MSVRETLVGRSDFISEIEMECEIEGKRGKTMSQQRDARSRHLRCEDRSVFVYA